MRETIMINDLAVFQRSWLSKEFYDGRRGGGGALGGFGIRPPKQILDKFVFKNSIKHKIVYLLLSKKNGPFQRFW